MYRPPTTAVLAQQNKLIVKMREALLGVFALIATGACVDAASACGDALTCASVDDSVSTPATSAAAPSSHVEQRRRRRRQWKAELKRGRSLAQQGQLGAALVQMQRAVQRKKGARSLTLRRELVNVLSALGRDAEAGTHVKRLHLLATELGSSAERADASYAVAKWFLKTKPHDGMAHAMAALRECLHFAPGHANARHWLAHQLSRMPTGYAEAAALLRPSADGMRLNRLTDSHPLDSLMLLGQAEERVGDLEASLAAFRRSSELYRQERGRPHGQRLAERLRFRFGLAHYQLCRLLLLTRQNSEALQAATWASQEFEPVYQLTDVLALAQGRAGHWDEVLKTYRTAINKMRDWPTQWREMPERVFGSSLAWMVEQRRKMQVHKQRERSAAGPHYIAPTATDSGGWSNWTAQVLMSKMHEWTNTNRTKESDEFVELSMASVSATPASTGVCNIDRRDSLTRREFLEQYAHRNRPVIVRNQRWADGRKHWLLQDWPAKESWTRQRFLARYANISVELKNSSYIAFDTEFGGLPSNRTTIANYVAAWDSFRPRNSMGQNQFSRDQVIGLDPPYLFGKMPLPGLRDAYREPSLFRQCGESDDDIETNTVGDAECSNDNRIFAHNKTARDRMALFFAGPALSGVSLHMHTNAWNALLYGRKRWFLLPPNALWGPTGMPMMRWVHEFYDKLAPDMHECVQEAGEVLYVPSDWYHGVLNLKDSVGIVVEMGHNVRLLERLLAKS